MCWGLLSVVDESRHPLQHEIWVNPWSTLLNDTSSCLILFQNWTLTGSNAAFRSDPACVLTQTHVMSHSRCQSRSDGRRSERARDNSIKVLEGEMRRRRRRRRTRWGLQEKPVELIHTSGKTRQQLSFLLSRWTELDFGRPDWDSNCFPVELLNLLRRQQEAGSAGNRKCHQDHQDHQEGGRL